jgi:hypothetical protein
MNISEMVLSNIEAE